MESLRLAALAVAAIPTLAAATGAAEAPKVGSKAAEARLRVLLVTGGHDFEREPFLAMFRGFEDVELATVEHPRAHARLQPDAAKSYDVLVLYDMPRSITEEARSAFVSLLKRGKGVVALHHSLASYPGWPEYERIIGGRYRETEWVDKGVKKPASTFQHDVTFTVRAADPKHPVTQGVEDFEIRDETYNRFSVRPGVKPLLKTEEPTSGPIIGWAHTYGKSRVVYLALGHDRNAYEHPSYRRLVHQAIRWVAKR